MRSLLVSEDFMSGENLKYTGIYTHPKYQAVLKQGRVCAKHIWGFVWAF